MKMRALSAVAIAGALFAAGCGSSAKVKVATLSWHRCGAHFKCATLRVPVSYANPGGPQVPISVVELGATRPHPPGDVVFNPGGPGESGVQWLERVANGFPAALRERFNLVSFD